MAQVLVEPPHQSLRGAVQSSRYACVATGFGVPSGPTV